MVFYNVAGLKNKDADFWETIRRWDIIFMLETWTNLRDGEK